MVNIFSFTQYSDSIWKLDVSIFWLVNLLWVIKLTSTYALFAKVGGGRNFELVYRYFDATFQIWPKSLNRVTLEVVAGQAGPAFEAHLHPEEAPGFQEQKQIGY